jgi:hypothetical protein
MKGKKTSDQKATHRDDSRLKREKLLSFNGLFNAAIHSNKL